MADPQITYPRRGEVYLVSFDPALGAEMTKTRPALILQNDIGNRHSAITIVAAITSTIPQPLYPTQVLVKTPEGGLDVDSVVHLSHIRSVDKERLLKRLGALKPATLRLVNQALMISLGVVQA